MHFVINLSVAIDNPFILFQNIDISNSNSEFIDKVAVKIHSHLTASNTNRKVPNVAHLNSLILPNFHDIDKFNTIAPFTQACTLNAPLHKIAPWMRLYTRLLHKKQCRTLLTAVH